MEQTKTNEEQKVVWKNYRGKLLGLASLPTSGLKQDQTQWTRNVVRFTHNDVDIISFATFKVVNGLQIQGTYHVVYKEEEIQGDTGTFMSRTAIKIELSEDGKPLGFIETQPLEQPTTQEGVGTPTEQSPQSPVQETGDNPTPKIEEANDDGNQN